LTPWGNLLLSRRRLRKRKAAPQGGSRFLTDPGDLTRLAGFPRRALLPVL